VKRNLISGLALSTLISSGTVAAYDLDDNYIGGSNPRDVIGSDSVFNTHGLNASISGSILTVDIFTNFAGKADEGHFSGLTQTAASGWGNGIGYGDLFLASSTSDGEWEYGFSLDNRWSETGGTGSLFLLNGSNFLYSDDFISSGGYRNGHEVAVDTDAAGVDQVGTGSWSVNDSEGIVSFAIALEGTGLPYGNGQLRLGWGMTCANDVIQGTVETHDVPEPGALGLVGLGLLGTVIGRRRKKTVK